MHIPVKNESTVFFINLLLSYAGRRYTFIHQVADKDKLQNWMLIECEGVRSVHVRKTNNKS